VGWEARFTGEDAEGAANNVRDALFARSAGILSRELRDRCAMVAGCGSVGSYMASQLARSGVGRLTLLDPECVEAANLSRSAYEAQDVGHPKTEALARCLLRIDPALHLTLHRERLDALEATTLDAMVRASDVVVAATDDPAAQRALNRFAYARGKPALFVGLYAGAEGGEVLVTVPGRTPCYLCATRTRHQAERAAGRVASDVDYGSGRLPGELALGVDVQHVASAAVKLALALLVPAGAKLKAFADDVLADGTSYLTMSMVPRYWFYPRIFGDAPGQGAYQSVWLTPTRSEECPVCGSPEHRVEPLEVPLRAPRREALLASGSDSP
jgi:molybdopterin/thiamine biosynthesis adenylyltransferase